jgi:hypothetical protein
MTNLLRTAGGVLLSVWELPQNLLGLALLALMRRRITERRRESRRLFLRTPSTGVSLGWFVFWCTDEAIRRHEYGHTIQSRALGPLYLPLVGLPSVLRALYARWYRRRTGQWWPRYFDGYPEDWADRLGGVDNRRRSSV